MLSAGQLDRTLVIEQPLVTRDGADGSQLVTWSPVATVWAQLLESSTSGDETLRDGVLAYGRPSRVRIRWRSGIEPTMRLNLGGRLMQIVGTAEIGRRRLLEISCREWSHE